MWIPAPSIFALFIAWRDKSRVVDYAYAYLLVNVIGVTMYYLYPAAPPWYYLTYGDVFDPSVGGSEALLSEFDRLTGTSIFHDIYTKGTNVFGAIPSLHAAYPMLCLMFAIKWRYKGWIFFFALMCLGTWLGAVYSQHHYVVDVLLGIMTALLTYYLIHEIFKLSIYKSLYKWYSKQFGEQVAT